MKKLKFLFVVLLSCIVGILQTNAQPPDIAIMEGTIDKDVVYEVDGIQYYGVSSVDFHAVGTPYIPVEMLHWVAKGELVKVYECVNDEPGALLDYIPLPKHSVKGYDPNIVYYEKITVSSDGSVLVIAQLPVFYKFDLLYE